jgi:hypothetical protein
MHAHIKIAKNGKNSKEITVLDTQNSYQKPQGIMHFEEYRYCVLRRGIVV